MPSLAASMDDAVRRFKNGRTRSAEGLNEGRLIPRGGTRPVKLAYSLLHVIFDHKASSSARYTLRGSLIHPLHKSI